MGTSAAATWSDSDARAYQAELLEYAKTSNVIAYLDTGAGKTFIAVMLIKWKLMQLEEAGHGHVKKLIFFLAPKVPLLQQQSRVLRAHLGGSDVVAHYQGSMGVDNWTKQEWRTQLDSKQVLAMTPQILVNLLVDGYVKVCEIALIVFDEAHHARQNHPSNNIMKNFYFMEPKATRPHIFGMTASPVNSKNSKGCLLEEIQQLGDNLDSQVVTTTNRREVEAHAPVATVRTLEYQSSQLPESLDIAITTMQRAREWMNCADKYQQIQERKQSWGEVSLTQPDGSVVNKVVLLDVLKKNTEAGKFVRLLEQVIATLKEVGVWCAAVALQEMLRPPDKLDRKMEILFDRTARSNKKSKLVAAPDKETEALALTERQELKELERCLEKDIAALELTKADVVDERAAINKALRDCVKVMVQLMVCCKVTRDTLIKELRVKRDVIGSLKTRQLWMEVMEKVLMEVDPMHDTQENTLELMARGEETSFEETMGHSLLSTKTVKLLQHMATYEDAIRGLQGRHPDEQWSCIIFVERRQTSYTLTQLLCTLSMARMGGFLKPAFFVGQSVESSTSSHVYTQDHERVMIEFRKGNINCLVCTAVAEEGLDLRSCQVVICWDLPQTPRSFTQMKGRARAADSSMWIMVKQGIASEQEQFQKLIDDEEAMRQAVLESQAVIRSMEAMRSEREGGNEQDDDEACEAGYHTDPMLFFKVDHPDGGNMPYEEGVARLHEFCQKLPKDRYTDLRPRFSREERDGLFRFTVILPPNCSVRYVQGGWYKRVKTALGSACVQAFRELHKAGIVDNHLQPTWGKSSVNFHIEEIHEDLRGGLKKYMPPVMTRQKVPQWMEPPQQAVVDDTGDACSNLWLYLWEVDGKVDAIGMLMPHELPQLQPITAYLEGKTGVQVRLQPRGCCPVPAWQVHELKHFHRLIVRNMFQRDLVSMGEEDLEEGHDTGLDKVQLAIRALLDQNNYQVASFKTVYEVERSTEREGEGEEGGAGSEDAKEEQTKKRSGDDLFGDVGEGSGHFSYEDGDWAPGGSYFILAPIKEIGKSTLPDFHSDGRCWEDAIDWDYVRYLTTDDATKGLYRALEDGRDLEHVTEEDLSGFILITAYNQWCYAFQSLQRGLNIDSVMPDHTFLDSDALWEGDGTEYVGRDVPDDELEEEEHMTEVLGKKNRKRWSFREYYKIARGVELEDRELQWPLVRTGFTIGGVFSSLKRSNYLKPRRMRTRTNDKGWNIYLMPSLCWVHFLRWRHWQALLHFRCFVWRLQGQMLAHELREQLIPQQLTQHQDRLPDEVDVLHAITAKRTGEPFDSERLETLGDAYLKYCVSLYLFLKYPKAHEGQLTMWKHIIVSNQNLCRTAQELKLQKYVRVNQFGKGRFLWPGDLGDRTPPRKKVKGKVLADCVEALLGAFYDKSGHYAALCFMVHIRLLPATALDLLLPHPLSRTFQLPPSTANPPALQEENVVDIVEAPDKPDDVAANSERGGHSGISEASSEVSEAGSGGAVVEECGSDGGGDEDGPLRDEEEEPLFPWEIGGHSREGGNNDGESSSESADSDALAPKLGPLARLQVILGYHFSNLEHLKLAVTHCSCQSQGVGGCYQRLEFLGDAVLDVLVVHHHFATNSTWQPGLLAAMRESEVNYERLARITVMHNLQVFLQYDSKALDDDICRFVENYGEAAVERAEAHLKLLERKLRQLCADDATHQTGVNREATNYNSAVQAGGAESNMRYGSGVDDDDTWQAGVAVSAEQAVALKQEVLKLVPTAPVACLETQVVGKGVDEVLLLLHDVLEVEAREYGARPTFGSGQMNASKVLGDVLESLIGGVFMDSGMDLEVAWKLVCQLIHPMVTPETLPKHPKVLLLHKCQKLHYALEYDEEETVPGSAEYVVQVTIEGVPVGQPAGPLGLNQARMMAAENALAYWQNNEEEVEDQMWMGALESEFRKMMAA